MSSMEQIKEESSYKLLMKPLRESNVLSKSVDRNIFSSLRNTQPITDIGNISQRIRGRSFDIVGSKEFRDRYCELPIKTSISQMTSNPEEGSEQKNTFYNTKLNMTSSINRSTILSKLTHSQKNANTKEKRQMERYKQYKKYWEKESDKIKTKTQLPLIGPSSMRNSRINSKKNLLQDSVKEVIPMPNQQKQDILKTYVVNYWQMSLRNNSKILKRHLNGNQYSQDKLNQLLQTAQGIKHVERSVPCLPTEQLKNMNRSEFVLLGRNKQEKEMENSRISPRYRSNFNTNEIISTSRSAMSSTYKNKQEVYKIDYRGENKWMSMDGLSSP